MPDDRVERLNDALPQTQCTRCGYPSCHAYAQAIVHEGAAINRCPPGGAEGIQRLAALSGHAPLPLDPRCGVEGPRRVFFIDEAHCIGCTLCIKACPVDCIIGAPKRMHSIIEADCTGCELCLPVCPVDCIESEVASPGLSGWAAWSTVQADQARRQYELREARRVGPAPAQASSAPMDTHQQKRALVQAAMEQAQKRRQAQGPKTAATQGTQADPPTDPRQP